MKFPTFTLVTSFLLVIAGCSKESDAIVIDPPVQSPVQETKPVHGTWMGFRIGLNKSIPVNFGFHVKDGGKLDILDQAKQVIGSGTWTFINDQFNARFTLVPGTDEYSVRSDFFEKPGRIGGSWGYGTSDLNGGTWEMTKVK